MERFITTSDLDNAIEGVSSGISTAKPQDTPVAGVKIYNVSTAGVYNYFLKAGGTAIEVTNIDLDAGLVTLRYNGYNWEKVITTIQLSNFLQKNAIVAQSVLSGFIMMKPGPLDALRGPYSTLAAACLAIPNTTVKVDGVDRNLRDGKIVDIGTTLSKVPHEWRGGFADGNLFEYFINKADSIIVESINEIDRNSLLSGYWNFNNGAVIPSDNWVRTPKLPIKDLDYVLAGVLNIPTTAGLILFFDSIGDIVPNTAIMGKGTAVNNPFTFHPPAGVSQFALNVANATGIGLSPTNNTAANRIIVRKGSDPTYVPYGYSISVNSITGVGEKINEQSEVIIKPTKDKVASMLTNFNEYSRFDGTAEINLLTEQNINVTGDYLEFTSNTGLGSVIKEWLSMFGKKNNIRGDVFGYYTFNQMWLRPSGLDLPYVVFDNLPNLSEFRKIKLMVNGSNWELYIDNILVSTKPKTTGLLVNSIGNAYDTAVKAKFNLKAVKIHTAASDLEILDPSTFTGAVNVKGIVELDKSNSPSLNPMCFVSFDASLNAGAGGLMIYIKRESYSDVYVGHEIRHEVDMSPSVYRDLWRIYRADQYKYANGVMTLTNTYAIGIGESEFVYQQTVPKKADFVGGFHGDEVLSKFELFINGIKKDLTASFGMTACEYAFYMQKSTMHETSNTATPTEAIPGNPKQADHIKITTFANSSYKTQNTLKFTSIFTVYVYCGICCYGKIGATLGINDFLDSADFIGDGTAQRLRSDIAREVKFSNSLNKLGGSVKSRVIEPAALEKTSYIFVADRPVDSKFYQRTQDFTTAIGDVFKSEMEVLYS